MTAARIVTRASPRSLLASPSSIVSRPVQSKSFLSTNGRNTASAAVAISPHEPEYEASQHSNSDKAPCRPTPLSAEQRRFLDSALRVNQAGELAATLIYTAQTPQLVQSHPQLRTLMKHMYDQEAGHLKIFNELLAKHRIRPTVLYPVWKVAARTLGWTTAVMGREAAMACTEAVETEIGDHYNNQVRVLLNWARDLEARGETVSEEMRELLVTLRRIRDEELEHLDHAVENDAKQAKPYEILTNVIRGGCRTAIWISERV
ncbi:Rubrerythrin family protein [Tothia fuscella]|uniref:5-demethoxyubiquinone hydroxylase, mitochondrial n=1 Tax=Tothia fuscella TaxID=1048955 RepID=A0A9P4NLZ2_9PEZI|nr:Rubrerythrin family protein [Tothia fuscella]